MVKIIKHSLFLLCCSILFVIPLKVSAMDNKVVKEDSSQKAICDFKMEERKLWIDHVSWTRNFIISSIASLEDKDAMAERLLKNQDDIGNSIKPYYGDEAGNKLSALLREHILIASQVVDAAKNGNNSDLKKYNQLWYENADKIANFLSNANPNYSNKELRDMLYKHLDLTKNEAISRLNRDWKSDVDAYDKGEDHMVMFSDMLSDGIVKQFPKSFK